MLVQVLPASQPSESKNLDRHERDLLSKFERELKELDLITGHRGTAEASKDLEIEELERHVEGPAASVNRMNMVKVVVEIYAVER